MAFSLKYFKFLVIFKCEWIVIFLMIMLALLNIFVVYILIVNILFVYLRKNYYMPRKTPKYIDLFAGCGKEDDQRNQLVQKYIEFISLVQPKILFFENVKGFTQEFKKNKEKGEVYASLVEQKLDELGYYVKGQLVNFGEYGVTQKRTRFILVGVRKDLKKSSQELVISFFKKLEANKYSFLESKQLTVETNLNDAISDLLSKNGKVICPDTPSYQSGIYTPEPLTEYQ